MSKAVTLTEYIALWYEVGYSSHSVGAVWYEIGCNLLSRGHVV